MARPKMKFTTDRAAGLVLDLAVRLSSQPVVYLDFDGVLHPHDVLRHPKRGIYLGMDGAGHTLFEHAGLLAEMLEPYPEVGIVLSTSWVRVLSYSKARRWLPGVLDRRVVGATFHTAMDRLWFTDAARGVQVLSDVGRRRPSAWVALDDDNEGWPASSLSRLVPTHPIHGLAEPGVRAMAVAAFEREFAQER